MSDFAKYTCSKLLSNLSIVKVFHNCSFGVKITRETHKSIAKTHTIGALVIPIDCKMNKFTSSNRHFAFVDDVNLANRCSAAFADSHFMGAHVEAEKNIIYV